MNILHILAFRLGMVTIALVLALGAKIASAEIFQVGQYFAEARGLESQSSDLHRSSSQIAGLNNRLENSGSGLQADAKDLTVALADMKADVTETEIQVNLSADVLFDFDKSSIKPEADAALKKVALIIAEKRKGNVIITGHTDAVGSDSYNQKL
jgi:outer membrane protein OmpA-like peptidoglycan-associated protein